MTVLVPRKANALPGQPWWDFGTYGDGEGRTVELCCPLGHVGTLWSHYPGDAASTHHAIAPDGTVSPSVVCPRPRCGYHVMVQLQDWPGPAPA